MSDKNNRVKLNDDAVEKIAGGELLYYDEVNGEHFLWSDEDPDHQYNYDYSKLKDISIFLIRDCRGLSDAQKIAALLEKGLITER